MRNSLLGFSKDQPAVLSLGVLATTPEPPPPRPFQLLVRHLLARFFFNETMASEEDLKRTLQLCALIALPGLLLALYLSPSYHAYPVRRTYWPQVGDHYFYVLYSFVTMGVATAAQSDRFFADLLDIFVLSTLPIERRRLLLARVVAMLLFLLLVLTICNSLGVVFLPAVADLAHFWPHLFAHVCAVVAAGIFASALYLSLLTAMLICLGPRLLHRVLPLLQAGAVTVLLTLLFLFPAVSSSLFALLTGRHAAVYFFPPFWFVGLYERLLVGGTALPVFGKLAGLACAGVALSAGFVLLTYPLAYTKRVRQLIEGLGPAASRRSMLEPLDKLLHVLALRSPAHRATFHLVRQSLLRSRRHRILLATCGGLGLALTLSELLTLRTGGLHISLGLNAAAIRSAVPIIAFWVVIGIRNAVAAPLDRRAGWIFRAVAGRPSLAHLTGTIVLSTAWSWALCLLAWIVVQSLDGSSRPHWSEGIVAAGISLLLADVLFLPVLAFPFTTERRSAFTDLPLALVRYGIAFPLMVTLTVRYEEWMELDMRRMIEGVILLLATHFALRYLYWHRVDLMRMGGDFEDDEAGFQQLGLAD